LKRFLFLAAMLATTAAIRPASANPLFTLEFMRAHPQDPGTTIASLVALLGNHGGQGSAGDGARGTGGQSGAPGSADATGNSGQQGGTSGSATPGQSASDGSHGPDGGQANSDTADTASAAGNGPRSSDAALTEILAGGDLQATSTSGVVITLVTPTDAGGIVDVPGGATSVPEPAALTLFGVGIVALGVIRFRKRSSAQ
jgi:hypothetical protein